LTEAQKRNNKNLHSFNDDKSKVLEFNQTLFNKIKALQAIKDKIWINDIITIVLSTCDERNLSFEFDLDNFKKELKRITSKFLENSYATCFSENNDNFLMWSHYASRHSGVCLGFELENPGLFPYIYKPRREFDYDKYKKRISEWEFQTYICWDRIKKVNYENEHPYINFFDFLPVFENEYDLDLIGLSKPWTHAFAHQLELVFSTKTAPWKYEKEWRIVCFTAHNTNLHTSLGKLRPKAIYMGEFISKGNEILITKIATDKNIELYKAQSKMSTKTNKLEFKKINITK